MVHHRPIERVDLRPVVHQEPEVIDTLCQSVVHSDHGEVDPALGGGGQRGRRDPDARAGGLQGDHFADHGVGVVVQQPDVRDHAPFLADVHRSVGER